MGDIYICEHCATQKKHMVASEKDYKWSIVNKVTFSCDTTIPDQYQYKGFYKNPIPEDNLCQCCGNPLKKMNLSQKEFLEIIKYSANLDYILALDKLKVENIIEFEAKQKSVTEYQKVYEQKENAEQELQRMRVKMEQMQNTIDRLQSEASSNYRNQVRCPRCGSTQISTGQTLKRGLFGLVYNQITVNRCANCGCTWEPGK